jgi:hypothetical protein
MTGADEKMQADYITYCNWCEEVGTTPMGFDAYRDFILKLGIQNG